MNKLNIRCKQKNALIFKGNKKLKGKRAKTPKSYPPTIQNSRCLQRFYQFPIFSLIINYRKVQNNKASLFYYLKVKDNCEEHRFTNTAPLQPNTAPCQLKFTHKQHHIIQVQTTKIPFTKIYVSCTCP